MTASGQFDHEYEWGFKDDPADDPMHIVESDNDVPLALCGVLCSESCISTILSVVQYGICPRCRTLLIGHIETIDLEVSVTTLEITR